MSGDRRQRHSIPPSSAIPPLADDLWRVVEDTTRRRLAGELLSDEDVVAAHIHLQPQLEQQLRELRRVERARGLVTGSSRGDSLAGFGNRRAGGVIERNDIPGYDIIDEIHRGGQGVVYRALQRSTGRMVAVKIMLSGAFAGPHERTRFAREVRILAGLRHPNIVTIHDSGSAGQARYFVMDYVDGAPLDRFVSERGLALSERLRLFAKICAAVNSAHLLGVIHRDLKPGNILVDAAGEPHILDFGLAKRADWNEPDAATVLTTTGQFVGSLPWASPEQARGRQNLIDLRTDVYALGVQLYQLMTGEFPYDVITSLDIAIHNIVHVDPVNPRTRNRQLDDDLSAIVLMALRKQPELRYETAGSLGRDIERYLAGEPIAAKRDSGWYVLRKTLRRYRIQTGVAAGFVLLVLGSAVALGILYQDQKTQRLRAEGAEDLAEVRLTETTSALETAQSETRKADATIAFLEDMLAAVDPNEAQGNEVSVRQVLDQAAARIENELTAEPEVAAAVHRTIASTYLALGLFDDAEHHFREALKIGREQFGENHPDTLNAENGLASALESLSFYDEAEALYRHCLDAARRNGGADSPQALDALHNLANLLRNLGRFEEAKPLLEQALEGSLRVLGPEHSSTLTTRKVLAGLWQDLGDYDTADAELRYVLEVQRNILGDKSPQTMGTMNNLAMLLKSRGMLDEAAPLYEEINQLLIEVYGPDHPETLRHMNSYGRLLTAQGRLFEAELVLRDTLDAQTRILGENHKDTIVTTNNLALLLSDDGRLTEAEPLARAALQQGQALLGDEHPDTLIWMNNLANLLSRQGASDEAEALYRTTLDLRRRILGDEHPQTLTSISNLANELLNRGEVETAESMFREVLSARERILGSTHPDTILAMNNLTKALLEGGRLDEAELVGRSALETSADTLGIAHPLTLLIKNNLAAALSELGHDDEAISLLTEAIRVADQELPPTHVYRYRLHATFGKILSGAGRDDEAEPHLTLALTGLVDSVGPRQRDVREVAADLLEVCRAQGDAARVDELLSEFPFLRNVGE